MEPKVNYIVVGAFVLLLGAMVLGAVLWLGKTDYRGVYDRYYVYTKESVAGLSVDSTVKYRGVDVGRVKEIILNPENSEEVRITLDIVGGTPVKTDTQAVLVTQGLTGLVTLNLTGGTREAPPLAPVAGQMYPVITSVPSLFGRLDGTLAKLLSEQGLSNLVANVNGLAQNASLVLDEENRAQFRQILKDLGEITKVLAARSGQVDRGAQHAAEAAERMARLTEHLGTQLPALLDRMGKSAAALQQMTVEVARTSREVGEMVGANKPGIEQFSRQTLADAGLLVSELRQLTATMNRMARLTEHLGTQLPALLDRMGKSAAALQQMTVEVARTSREVGEMVGANKPGIEQFSRQTLADAGLLVSELRQLTATMNRVAQQVERQPNVLVLGRPGQSKGPGE